MQVSAADLALIGYRFWEKVGCPDGEDGCWPWLGAVRKGYGCYWLDGRLVSAHRLVYERHIGPIPDGFEIDHVCNNRCCVNPNHLRKLPHRQNTVRRTGPITHCPHGHPYTAENLIFRKRPGSATRLNRRCRTCVNAQERVRAARIAEAKRQQRDRNRPALRCSTCGHLRHFDRLPLTSPETKLWCESCRVGRLFAPLTASP